MKLGEWLSMLTAGEGWKMLSALFYLQEVYVFGLRGVNKTSQAQFDSGWSESFYK
jgi:hypothetical protein